MQRIIWSSLVLLAGSFAASCSDRHDGADAASRAGAASDGGSSAGEGAPVAGATARAGASHGGGSRATGSGSGVAGDGLAGHDGGGASDEAHAGDEGGTAGGGESSSNSSGAEGSGAGSGGTSPAGGVTQAGAGEGGGAGTPSTLAGERCVECGVDSCGARLAECEGNAECAPWLDCVRGCDSAACVATCDAEHADVARVFYEVYSCLCRQCSDACAVTQACDKKCSDPRALPPITSAPTSLAETGLYASGLSLADEVRAYQVKYPLWSDGATKERYIYIPRCSTIDSSDMDHWEFPVGTRLWKSFSVDGRRVETRFMHRYGSATTDWLYATYGWDTAKPSDPAAATIVLHGLPNAGGTTHDIPDPWECSACHGKLPDKPLGFSAIQLSHGGEGLTMRKLSELGWLSVSAPAGFEVPGTATQRAALGYLHGNCGGCHNSEGAIPRDNPMKLRLLVEQTDYARTDTVLTTVGVPTLNENANLHGKPRIAPSNPSGSAIFLRMSDRDRYPMPPIATQVPDTNGGVAAVKAWIESLEP